MSGEFRSEHNLHIEATDDPELAKAHGLTQFDKATGQYRAPSAPDAGQRDGADVQEQRRLDALDEGNAQHEAEHGPEVTDLPKGQPVKKATGSKASQSKDDDKK